MEPEPVELHEVVIGLRWSTSAGAIIAQIYKGKRVTSAVSAILSDDGRTIRTVTGSVYRLTGSAKLSELGSEEPPTQVAEGEPIRWRLFNVHLLQPKDVDHA